MAEHVCPVWVGWLLVSPIRKLFENPTKILSPYIKPNMTVLEPGCAMGFFSLEAAKMVGPHGKVICLDLQAEMIRQLEKRAAKANLADRIQTRVCSQTSLVIDDLLGTIDFAFAIALVHEIPDPERFFREVFMALKPESILLFVEPKGHVNEAVFTQSINLAKVQGFTLKDRGKTSRGWMAVLKK